MSYEKWLKLYNRNMNYDVNLERFSRDFLRIWNENKKSPNMPLEKEYTPISVLGSGAFGIVKLCKNKKTESLYAIKIIEKEALIKTKQVEQVKSEKRILAAVCFPFLVYLVFSAKYNAYIYIGLPFISGGELYKYHQKSRRFPEKVAKFYAAQVFLALEYLHYLNVVYRDLKTENILIDASGYLKVTDFGFCKKIDDRTWTLCGTPEYLAPEIIRAKSYGKSVDWWSFGVLCFEFVAGYTPFRSSDVMVMYERICKGAYKMPSFFSKELKMFVDCLLQVDVTRRYGVLKNGTNDVKSLEWFKDMNWTALLRQESVPNYVPKLENEYDTTYFGNQNEKLIPFADQELFADEFADF